MNFANAGIPVVLKEINQEALDRGLGIIRKNYENTVAKGRMTPEQLMRRAAKLEKQMLRHARDLEFEEAARLRDEIRRIREEGLGLSDLKAG